MAPSETHTDGIIRFKVDLKIVGLGLAMNSLDSKRRQAAVCFGKGVKHSVPK